jgi:hypothetical protein
VSVHVPGCQDPADITNYFEALKRRNAYEEQEIDKVFIMRQEKERAIAEVEAQIQQIQVRSAVSWPCFACVCALRISAAMPLFSASSRRRCSCCCCCCCCGCYCCVLLCVVVVVVVVVVVDPPLPAYSQTTCVTCRRLQRLH